MHKVNFIRKSFDTIELSYSTQQGSFHLPDLLKHKKVSKENNKDVHLIYKRPDFRSREEATTFLETKCTLLEKGQRLFDYVIEDEDRIFRVAVNSKRMTLKVYAKAFYQYKYEEILEKLNIFMFGMFDIDSNNMKVSRFDIAVDFRTDFDFFNYLNSKMYYCRYDSKDDSYAEKIRGKRYKTGIVLKTNNLVFRAYDKALECIQKYDTDFEKYQLELQAYKYTDVHNASLQYYEDLQKEKRLVRFEYQFRRDIFENRIDTLKDLTFENSVYILNYYAENHTRLTCPVFRDYLEFLGEGTFTEPRIDEKEIDYDSANHNVIQQIKKYVKAFHKNIMRSTGEMKSLKYVLELIKVWFKHLKYNKEVFMEMLDCPKLLDILGSGQVYHKYFVGYQNYDDFNFELRNTRNYKTLMDKIKEKERIENISIKFTPKKSIQARYAM